MKFEYIIVQCGGRGERLMPFTMNRPKALVTVNNLPILFHLFQRYPDKKFLIIGDYKYDVLENYLESYAKVKYLMVHACGKGNITGIDKALSLIPGGEPFMLLWSDIILPEYDYFEPLPTGNYIGVTDEYTCSWNFSNGKLEKIKTEKEGVAGCFVFDSKERFGELPSEGSFTKYLQEMELIINPVKIEGIKEVGTINSLNQLDSKENRCRPYNKMTITEDKVVKEGLTDEAKKLIDREVMWYQKVKDLGFKGIPKIYSLNPLTMERIHGENIFKVKLNNDEKKEVLDSIYKRLKELHQLHMNRPNVFDMQEDYFLKTIKRLDSIRRVIPFSDNRYITINGVSCKNVYRYPQGLQEMVNGILNSEDFGLIHGDCTLTNTMIDEKRNIYFIDARGYFGKTSLFGDVYYDWAKVYYSIQGGFDQFNIKNFTLEIKDNEVNYQIYSSGWEHLTEYFLNKIPQCDRYRIRLIHAIIWLSLASHCWEDYDSLCTAFYNGLYLLQSLDE